MSVQFYWIPGPLANYGTTENGFKGEVRVVSVADFQLVTHANEVQAQEIHSLRADIVDLIAEVARLQRLIQMASDTGDLYERKLDAHETAIGSLRSRLAEAERNEGTLLGMIRHQRDVLRECLPYINESMAGRRPGRSADDIRAAVKALTSDSAPAVEQRLWLWRNGDHFLAFEHLYPCFTPGGDPMTLGEPVGYAIVKRSFDRAAGSASVCEACGGTGKAYLLHSRAERPCPMCQPDQPPVCDPTLTECPTCRNDFRKCPNSTAFQPNAAEGKS